MTAFLVEGGKRLSGHIPIAGNKNSVLPIMAACLLTEETCVLENVPNISDVEVMAKLLKMAGASVEGMNTKTIKVTAKNITPVDFPTELTESLRASIMLLGAMVSRSGKVSMGYPGGDIIGRRPIETHLQVLEALGAKTKLENDTFQAEAILLKGTEIFLQEASVTATENAIIAACLAKGETIIKRAASEPHVVDLCLFLGKMGANISGTGTNVLKIYGSEKLFGAKHAIRPDHIEVGTFAILGAVTKGKITMSPVIKEDLDMILLTLARFGVNLTLKGDTLEIADGLLKAVPKIVTDVWPGFPTDLMAPMIVLATQAEGVTLLHDWMYESRMFFVDKLLSMGAKVEIADPHRVLVYGPSKLRGQKLDTPDIRAGVALVIAALAAKGKSRIDKAELVKRGYENIVTRLSALGANIKEAS